MKLTWRDAATVPFMAAIIGIYTAHLNGADGWLLASTRGNAAAILVLGTVGGCGFGSAQELFEREQGRGVRLLYTVVSTVLGVTALAAAIIALVSASGVALALLFAATMALWVLSTLRHLFSAGHVAGSTLGPRTHEVIDQPRVRY